MGDRNNPITFGPEWLRSRLTRERGAGNGANNQMGGATVGSSGGGGGGAGAVSSSTSPNQTQASKVQLAKLRYGREEMLALYDRSVEPPSELRAIEMLFNVRVKAPAALLNTFEDEMRDNARGGGTQPSGLTSADRYAMGRGAGRGMTPLDRGRATRAPFVRSLPTTRHVPPSVGSKRQGANTNWRQQRGFDELEELPPSDGSAGSRSRPHTRWDRDWGDRPQERSQDRTPDKQSWNTNRRQWNENQDENLPEWAMENAEAGGGTFDSSGAFHGYSNDDNLSRNPDSRNQESYPLARSHTTGYYTSLSKNQQSDDNYEESWSAEKAKNFDAIDVRFKKQMSAPEKLNPETLSSEEEYLSEKKLPVAPVPPENSVSTNHLEDNGSFNKNTSKSKTFDSLLRSDVKMEEATDETGDFQSVMITPNNSLRQKHQNIGPMANESSKQSLPQPLMPNNKHTKSVETSEQTKRGTPEENKTIDDFFEMTLEDKNNISKMMISNNMTSNSVLQSGNTTASSTMSQMPALKMTMSNSGYQNVGLPLNSIVKMPSSGMPNPGLSSPRMLNAMDIPMPGSMIPGKGLQDLQGSRMQPLQTSGLQSASLQSPGMQSSGMQSVGITNSALNASLGLPISPNSAPLGMPLQGVPQPILPNSNLQSAASALPRFQTSNIQGLGPSNMAGNSLFLGKNSNSTSIPMPPTSDIPMPNSHSNQPNMFPLHGLQHSSSQSPFGSSMYESVMMQQQQPNQSPNAMDQWYYEDPEKMIQGPFSSKEMYTWYRAGFFTSSLMVRRACSTHMRPLGSYGPVVPFAQPDIMPPFPMPQSFEPRLQAPHESMLNSQQAINLDGMNLAHNRNPQDNASLDPIQFGTVGMMRNTSFGQTPVHESPWNAQNMMWTQQRNSTADLSMFFWDQPSAMLTKSMLPEDIAKEMKTEDQILAQLRAQSAQQNLQFLNDQPPSTGKEEYANTASIPNLEELQKLLQKDGTPPRDALESQDVKVKSENPKSELVSEEMAREQSQTEVPEPKPNKQVKESDKSAKNKENNTTKNKNKKAKDEKREDTTDNTQKDEDSDKAVKRSLESSPTKTRKEDKVNKKALENEKKEWLKDGFTIVKGAEKNVKDKRRADEAKMAEEMESRRKEEDKLAALEEDKKKKQMEAMKKQQQQQESQHRQAAELVMKKAPWSMASNQAQAASNKEGLTLAEIQRLEKEKKMEQMKEQQQMMQILVQQQQAAMAREQEMQAGLGWSKKKLNNSTVQGQSLTEIQAEARKNAAAAVAAAALAVAAEELAPVAAPTSQVPWGGSAQNGGTALFNSASTLSGGFWDTQPTQLKQEKPEPVKQAEPPKQEQPKKSKRAAPSPNTLAKKETTPAVEFENWCNSVLSPWSSKIDVPTFVGFLRDIESPYEVKDYVKCYLGDTKESIDIARQFLERRSKLLRVGMVTPSDDLCSPAMAINPRTNSGSDYTEVKGKGKKTKKNKMLKVDARILGFSVTASEDRINVGDIDTA